MDIKTAIDNLLERGEITAEEHEKVAGTLANNAGVVKNIMQAVGLTALTGIAGYQLLDIIKQKHAESVGFKSMMEKNPDLAQHPEQQVRDFYGVVQTFSPKASSNPLVSGALVNKMIQFGGVDHKIVQDLAQIEGPTRNIIYDVAMKAGQTAAGFPGGGGGGGDTP